MTIHTFVQLLPVLAALAVFLYTAFFPGRVAHWLGSLWPEHGFMAQRVNRTDAERLFITVKNNYSTASLSNGQAVSWDYQVAKDGLAVQRPTARATNAGMAGAGVVAETIVSSGYGLIQVYGYHSAARCRTVTGGSPAIVAGRPLVINVAGSVFCLESVSTASTVILTFPLGFSLGATAGFTTAAIAAFVRAM
jgi:hypothetical protein